MALYALHSSSLIASFVEQSHEIIKSAISQSHVCKLDQKKYSEFYYYYAGLGAGCFTKEPIDSFVRGAL